MIDLEALFLTYLRVMAHTMRFFRPGKFSRAEKRLALYVPRRLLPSHRGLERSLSR